MQPHNNQYKNWKVNHPITQFMMNDYARHKA